MKNLESFRRFFIDNFFGFEIPKVLEVHSKPIGFIYRTCQFIMLTYIVVYVMYLEHGYQSTDTAKSGVTTKIKGIRYSKLPGTPPAAGDVIWDSTEYVRPEHMNSAIFIITRKIVTKNQTYGFCDEEVRMYSAQCKVDADCQAGEVIMIGNGVKSGRCISSTQNPDKTICEIYGWCPTENDNQTVEHKIVHQAENYTILLKNSIEFPRFKVKRKNIFSWMDKQFIDNCRFDPMHPKNKFCPIFKLGDIVKLAEGEFSKIWIRGGLMSIHIDWNCNLDFDVDYCVPEYSFRHLDDIYSKVGQGLNYRFAHYHQFQGREYRTLTKAYGIKIFLSVSGTARKFDLYTVSMNLGSSIGIFGVASLIGDALAMYLLRRRDLYTHPCADLEKRTIRSVNDWRHRRQKKKSVAMLDNTNNSQEHSQEDQMKNDLSTAI